MQNLKETLPPRQAPNAKANIIGRIGTSSF